MRTRVCPLVDLAEIFSAHEIAVVLSENICSRGISGTPSGLIQWMEIVGLITGDRHSHLDNDNNKFQFVDVDEARMFGFELRACMECRCKVDNRPRMETWAEAPVPSRLASPVLTKLGSRSI